MTPDRIAQDAARKSDRLSDVTARLHAAGQRHIDSLVRKLDAMDRLRETLSYKATLARGYAVVRGGGEVLTTKAAAEQASGLEVEFADGRLKLGGGKAAPKKAPGKPPQQGSLF